MAQKRMFDKTITNNDKFLEMPDSTQNLYFHLSMEADDDGFVDNWKSVMRMTGKKEDDLKLLIAKSFIIPFETGVIVIKHWRINNYLRKDRYNSTKYFKEKSQLIIEKNQEYSLINQHNEEVGIPSGIPVVDTEENRIEKNSIEEKEKEVKEKENIFDFVESEFGRTLSPSELEIISEWEDTELTRYAIKQSILNGAPRIKYIQTILDTYKTKNIKSIQEAKKDEEEFKKKKENSKYTSKREISPPEWIDKNIKTEIPSTEEKQEMEELLKEFK